MPVDGSAVVCRLEEGLVMEELDVGSDQVLDHIEDAVVVEQIAVVDVAFAHLHDLEHLGAGLVFGVEVVGIVDCEVAGTRSGRCERVSNSRSYSRAQQFDFVVREDFANVEVAVDPKAVDLFFGQGFALGGGRCFRLWSAWSVTFVSFW